MSKVTVGIESTAHTIGVGVFDPVRRRMLANVRRTYSRKYGGMRPSDAADHHSLAFQGLADEAGLDLSSVGAVGYSRGPGLAPCLRVGRTAAVLLSELAGVPVVPVHHSVAHIEIGRFATSLEDPLVIYVSGGNTQLIVRNDSAKRYEVIGETLDIGLGNAIDVLARAMKLEDAHGGAVERLAREGSFINLPYTVKGMDFAFTGLVTRCEQLLRTRSREDVAHSFQEVAFAMLCEAAERALMLTRKNEVLLCGGVAQNRRLQEMVAKMCEENGARFGVPPDEYNRDNGAMVAYAAHTLADRCSEVPADIAPKWRIEDAPA